MTITVLASKMCVYTRKLQTDVSHLLVPNMYVIENVIELEPINILIILNEKDKQTQLKGIIFISTT
jgi:hypothetical protein